MEVVPLLATVLIRGVPGVAGALALVARRVVAAPSAVATTTGALRAKGPAAPAV
jgi:hypothetical protein